MQHLTEHHAPAAVLAPAADRDFAAVARLFAALHRFNAELDPRFALAEGWEALLREHFTRTHRERGSLWLLAWDGGGGGEPEPVGLLIMESHVDSPLFAHRRWAELVALYVAASHRGSDLGRRLVEAGTGWAAANGFDRVQLYLTASNARAKRFYASCGLAPAQEIWRVEITPRQGVVPPRDPSDHMHPELGAHHLAMELDAEHGGEDG